MQTKWIAVDTTSPKPGIVHTFNNYFESFRKIKNYVKFFKGVGYAIVIYPV